MKVFAARLFVNTALCAGFACAKITTKAYKVLWSVEEKKSQLDLKHI